MGARTPARVASGGARIRPTCGLLSPDVEARKQRRIEPEEGLERCRSCPSRLVYPLRWRRIGEDWWQLDLRCPDCDDIWRERCSTSTVKLFDKTLGRGREVLVSHLREIERIEREDEISRFVLALAADAILPFDFGEA